MDDPVSRVSEVDQEQNGRVQGLQHIVYIWFPGKNKK
jgi:hypothetical protein